MLGLAAQGVKICVDTILQSEVDDGFRGPGLHRLRHGVQRACSWLAAALAALVLPAGGFSRPVFLLLALGYLATALTYAHLTWPSTPGLAVEPG